MNVLLMTSAPPVFAPFSTAEKRPPLGLGFLISVLRDEGHRVWFVDNYLARTGIPNEAFLVENQIDCVGLYANTVCYQSTMEDLLKLQALREKGAWVGRIIIGGPHTSVGSHNIPDWVDSVVVGEGEKVIGAVVSGDSAERIVQGERVDDLDTLPFPAWDEFIWRGYDWRSPWADAVPVFTFNTSRGCPFHCTFCSVNGVWGRSYRYMSADRVISDLERMVRDYGMRVAYFREDHFTLNKKRTIAFCEGLLQRNLRIKWMCESRADHLGDENLVALMAQSGCCAVYTGVESGSPRMLEFLEKGESVEQFVAAFSLLKKHGIRTHASFVVGAPTETENDIALTRQLIARIQPDSVGWNVYTGLPGSPLYEYTREHGLAEFEDESGILYLKGHDGRVDEFYGGDVRFKIPFPWRVERFSRRSRLRDAVMWRLRKLLGLD